MPTVLFCRSMRVKPLKSKSFGFGNLFATFSRFLSSQWVPVVYGRTRRFAYFRVCASSSGAALGNRAGECLETEPFKLRTSHDARRFPGWFRSCSL